MTMRETSSFADVPDMVELLTDFTYGNGAEFDALAHELALTPKRAEAIIRLLATAVSAELLGRDVIANEHPGSALRRFAIGLATASSQSSD